MYVDSTVEQEFGIEMCRIGTNLGGKCWFPNENRKSLVHWFAQLSILFHYWSVIKSHTVCVTQILNLSINRIKFEGKKQTKIFGNVEWTNDRLRPTITGEHQRISELVCNVWLSINFIVFACLKKQRLDGSIRIAQELFLLCKSLLILFHVV